LGHTIFAKIYQRTKELLVYQTPTTPPRFVLGEMEQEKDIDAGEAGLAERLRELKTQLRYSYRLLGLLQSAVDALNTEQVGKLVSDIKEQCTLFEKELAQLSAIVLAYDSADKDPSELTVKMSLAENEKVLATLFNLPDNKDIVSRSFCLPTSLPTRAMIVFLDGLTDKQLINITVLSPLMLMAGHSQALYGNELLQTIINHFLPSNQTKLTALFADIEEGVSRGDTVLFIDGVEQAVLIDTKGWEHRSVDRPQNEPSVRGSQAAFTEALRVNTGLIRSMMHTRDLVTELFIVGDISKTLCAVMYLKSIANPALVAEVKRRITNIHTDYVTDIGVLEQFVEDHPNIPLPQTLSTERPDRVPVHLAEGRVAILMEGSPFTIVAPFSFISLFHSAEDYNLKPIPATFMRVLRLAGVFLATILPSLYLAISYFHQEALPTELALAIAGARERVPFPALVEIFMMEFSFELIREAGTRIPGMLGSTIGIVGAIIIGQAAVAANIVSPIMVVIVAVTGLASFTIPDYRLAFGIRIFRFAFLSLAAVWGLVGVAAGLLLGIAVLCYMKSFGVPYMVPIAPKTVPGWDIVVRGPAYAQEQRPDELNPRQIERQPNTSRPQNPRDKSRGGYPE